MKHPSAFLAIRAFLLLGAILGLNVAAPISFARGCISVPACMSRSCDATCACVCTQVC